MPKNTLLFNNKDDLIKYVKKNNYTTWIIGGEQIYNSFINLNDLENIYVTFINKKYNCDTFLPEDEIQDNYTLTI